MKKTAALSVLVVAVLLAVVVIAQPKEIPRIGWLGAGSSPGQLNRTEAFRRGLRELGYVEGKNIIVEYRHAEGKYDRLPMDKFRVLYALTPLVPMQRDPGESTRWQHVYGESFEVIVDAWLTMLPRR